MATNYPGALDAFTNPAGADNLDTPAVLHHEQHANINDAVEAIEAELGVNPSGSDASVAARLAALDSTIAGLPGGDANVFDAVTYGAVVDGATDDTAAWQAAINAAAAAGGGVVTSSLAGVSVIAGALQDTGGANAQLLLPDVHALDDAQMGLEIRGPWEQSASMSVVGAAVTPTTGLVLKSTLAAGSGAVIGAYGSGTSYQHFTFLNLTLRDLTVRTVANPTNTAVDLRHVNSCTLDGLVVDTGQYDTTLTQPTTATSFGLRLPALNNGANVWLGKVSVFGFYNGIEFSEHTQMEQVSVGGCRVGLTATAANHSSRIGRVLMGYCTTGLKFTGTHYVDVDQYAVEHASSGWYATTNDVDDASNYGHGSITWAAVLQGVGPHNSFTVNGGSNLNTYRVGTAPTGGGGSTVYTYRDRLVAASGNNTLTLGATPVAGTPLVWVNNVIKWPATDYAISGSTITFTSALSASDVVLCKYESLTAGAGASSLSSGAGVNIVDTFTRADSSSSLGSTTTGAKVWTQHKGTWGITSNTAYVSNGDASSACLASVDAGVGATDVTVAATFTAVATNTGGFFVRGDNAGNGYVVEVVVNASAAPRIYKATGYSYATLATGGTTTVAPGSVVTVELVGNAITVKDDGVTIVSATDSTYSSNTRHGLYVACPSATATPGFIDDFSIQS